MLFSFSLEESLKRAHISPLFKVTEGKPLSLHGRDCARWECATAWPASWPRVQGVAVADVEKQTHWGRPL